MFQPHLKASIRHAFKVPVRFDRDLIATEGETFPPGLVAISPWPNRRSLAAADQTFQAAVLEGNCGLSTKSQET
ncbi:hypothetical protein [Mesorhizobium sp.]|uniref:hypothetical protein n=1 Tax=Mesorhizobium sp. TaxID=1871066 RepID=UPI000FEA894A|nr:hypothetical protein [Mesorhizobium sp.]RWI14705.1 MAG: hypothetical protein EOQ92_28220 [Mesorhizobium sp.]RWK45332.1 MAG: hypothetical protein EOR47_31520 [Mesorhizobium sp.]RWK92994.1 MAG: hypothetical protein EOR45_27220 [Mesorhizobium sp.]RWK94707.1 MAG: hypothetical protein EOR53_17685 [Mesorhizobium sp.]TIP59566.1 MAG: hypothetical protein E5X56_09985 [Mesorhizobium sp.]